MLITRKQWLLIGALLVVAAATFRIAVAHWLPNDGPDDGRVYAQMARNLLEQHVFSHDAQPPYQPSLIRLPGYPVFLAGVYSIFGHTNNGAVRVVQALIDTATCGLIALLAFYWQPNEKRKVASAIGALALAAVCPFTTIYAATILTEVLTNFLMVATFVAVTLAFRRSTTEDIEEEKKRNFKRALLWWMVAGLLGGLNVLFRPDSGLFVAAVGLTLAGTMIWSVIRRKRSAENDPKRRRRFALPAHSKKLFASGLISGVLFSVAFAAVLTPWTIRNWRVFHQFQPLAPAHGEMPGEFVPRGYNLWLRTWLDDESYIAPFLWSLDTDPIDIDDVPPYAFDSPEEKKRVTTLLEAYNNEQDTDTDADADSKTDNSANPDEDKDESDNKNPNESDQPESDQKPQVEMTPQIDALKRAHTMWFDTHSQYWPFVGTLLPFSDLDHTTHQQIWLPLFAGLTAAYTLIGLAGMWFLWNSGSFDARRWLLLVVLAIVLRLILFSLIENPEPRYLVEFFPLLSVLGGIAIAQISKLTRKPQMDTDKHR
ncbi:MAG: hypothetical protein DMF72_14595 [Acidobacteria bacterium]|nr:MAG: hypothetical protein DMF72_14595 [Acidobacteriota bacterium]